MGLIFFFVSVRLVKTKQIIRLRVFREFFKGGIMSLIMRRKKLTTNCDIHLHWMFIFLEETYDKGFSPNNILSLTVSACSGCFEFLLFLGLRKLLILRSTDSVTRFLFLTLFRTFCDRVQNFSKSSKAAWKSRKDHT